MLSLQLLNKKGCVEEQKMPMNLTSKINGDF